MKRQDETEKIVAMANELRWSIGDDYHDKLTEGIYADAAIIARKSVIQQNNKRSFNLDSSIDKIVTSRTWGFPMMLLMLGVVLWLTIEGANVPSALLSDCYSTPYTRFSKDWPTTWA